MKAYLAASLALLLGSTALAPAMAQTGAKAKRHAAPAAAPVQKLQAIKIPYEKFVLPNGLTVIVHEDRKTPIVAVGIWYHVGSANETPGRTGFAHLFEHLMFNGSQHADTDWFEEMNAVGASGMNGSTAFDTTQYYQVVPRVALDRVLWLESDRMQNLLPAVDQAKLDEQRKVVQNEKRQRENQPMGAILDVMLHGSFPQGHPYSWAPIGSMEDLNAASLDDVREFFNKWYRPNNAVLVLSGDISVAEARQKAEAYFGDIKGGPMLNRSTEWIAKRSGQSRAEMEVQTANSMVFKFWNVPARASAEMPLLSLAAQTLLKGQTSWLHKRLVRERRLATEVIGGIEPLGLSSLFQLTATARSGVSIKVLEAAIDEEMAAWLRTGPTAQELDRIKFDRYSGFIGGQSSTMGKAMRLAESQVYAGTPDQDAIDQQIVYDATPAAVLASARKWLNDGALVIVGKPVPDYKVSGKPVDRAAKPPIGPMADFALPSLQRATLSNGIKVALAERHDVPTVNLSMMFDVGALPDRNPASAGLANGLNMAMMGTTTRSRTQITEESNSLGASVSWQVALETARFGMSALKINLDKTLDLYADILINPTFPDQEWNLQRDSFIADYEDSTRSNTGKLRRMAPRLIFGPEHPYAIRSTPETIRKVGTADLRGFYRKWIRPDSATILIVGDTTLAEMLPKLEQRLAGWKAPAGPAPVKPPVPAAVRPAGPRVVLIDQPGAQSTIIKVAQTSVPRNDPDFEVFNVANTVVGGHFLSRLNMNLREKKGWSYGASSSLNEAPVIGSIDAGGSVQADKTAEAMREIDRELREIGTTRPPTAEEIAAAKNALLLSLPGRLEGQGAMMSFYRDSFEYGVPENYWNGYIRRIQALTTEQVQAAARRLYRPEAFSWIVVGDLAKIEDDIRKLNLGEVQVVDGEGKRVR